MKLISGVLSNNAAKVRIALKEKGVDFETVEVPWTKENLWEPKPEILLNTNPRGQVPVLQDGDLILWDSTVINEYLDEKFPAPSLLPGDAESRALCRLWEDEGDFNQSHVGVLIRDVFLGAPGAPLTEEAENAVSALQLFYMRLDTQLGGREYICGDYSLADISVFLTLAFAITLGAPASQAGVQAWYDRMMARPVIAAEFESIMTAVAAL